MLSEHECKRCSHKWHPRMDDVPKFCPKCKSPYWNKERRVIRDKFSFDPSYKPSPDEIGDANEEILGFLHDRWNSSAMPDLPHHTPYINVRTLVKRLTENNPDEKHTSLIKYAIERLIVYKTVRHVVCNGVRAICYRDPLTPSRAITKTEIRVFRDRINKFLKKENKSVNAFVNIDDIICGVDVREINGIKIDKSRRIYCINTVLGIMRFDGELGSSL